MKAMLWIVVSVIALVATVFYPKPMLVVNVIVVLWVIISWLRIIKANEVALRRYFGRLDESKVCYSGLNWLPWFPGIGFVRFPTKLFKLTYRCDKGSTNNTIWSKDRQLLFPEVTLYLQFPYNFANFLADMVERDVPYGDEKALTNWAESVIIPALRKVLAKRTYREAINADERDAINTEVNDILMENGSVFRRAGIYGVDPKVPLEGTGYARLEIEQILLTDSLQSKEQEMATADLDIGIAGRDAKAQAAKVAAIDLAMDQWVKGQAKKMKISVKDAVTALKADGSYDRQYRTYKDLVLSAGNSLDVRRVEVGAPDGSPISGELGPAIALFAAAGFGQRAGSGGGDKGGGRKSDDRKRARDMTDTERDAEMNRT